MSLRICYSLAALFLLKFSDSLPLNHCVVYLSSLSSMQILKAVLFIHCNKIKPAKIYNLIHFPFKTWQLLLIFMKVLSIFFSMYS